MMGKKNLYNWKRALKHDVLLKVLFFASRGPASQQRQNVALTILTGCKVVVASILQAVVKSPILDFMD